MKNIFVILVLLTTANYAQSIERQVIGTTGNSFTDGVTATINFTVGEIATTTLTDGSTATLTQGFQQGESASLINCSNINTFTNLGWQNPNPITNTTSIIINADYNTSTNGSLDVCELTVNSGATLTINENNYIKIENGITNNGTIIVENTGSVVQVDNQAINVSGTNAISITKVNTTELTERFQFTYFSSPVINENLLAFDVWGDLNYLWQFDENVQNWERIPSATTTMSPVNGYIVRGNDTNDYTNDFIGLTEFSGAFNNGIITSDFYFTADGDSGTTVNNFDNDNNLIGNPYPSAINASLLLAENPEIGTLYFWTHNSTLVGNEYTIDDYAEWNLTGGTAAISGGSTPTGFIASGQGFFAEANGDEADAFGTQTISNITFNNSMRVVNNNTDFRRPTNIDSDKIWLNLSNSDGVFNQILIGFLSNTTENFDMSFDGLRKSNGIVSFYSVGLENQHYGIQALPLLEIETIIPLGFDVVNEDIRNLTISIDHFESIPLGLEDTNIYLKDNLLNNIHNLKISNYNFTTNGVGVVNSRFELLFERNALSLNETNLENSLIVFNESETEIAVKMNNSAIIKQLKVYDILGKLVIDLKPNNSDFIIDTHIKQGTVLFFKVLLENDAVLYQKFIKI